jgi:hypothetical protein
MAQDKIINIFTVTEPGRVLGRAAKANHLQLLYLGLLSVALLLGLLLVPPQAHADPGVEMTSGNIIVEDGISPGRTYHLPSITITNTGDQPGDYVMVLSYKLGPTQRSIPAGWVSFEPQRFLLNAQQSQEVGVTLSIPDDGFRPGDYFAYIESHQVSQVTGDVVGTAIATRLGFTLPASSWVSASTEQVRAFAERNADWAYIIVALLLGPVLLYLPRYLFRRFFRISIGFGRTQ